MKELQEFYRFAEQKHIAIDRFELSAREALSIMDDDGRCYIAINPAKITGEADERTKLAHELGHCVTGSFYNRYSNFDCRQKRENCADKWAIQEVIPEAELDEAVALGYTTPWELADHFGVSEAFMKKAICWYANGNVATELYF